MRSCVFLLASLTTASTILTLAQSAQSPPAQARPQREQPAVTFKVEVNYVEVDATVTDLRGNPVRGLSKDDFQLLEDGKPQAISVFSLVDIPIERAERPLFSPTPIEPDVKTNERGFDGRVFVLVLDDLHTHPLGSVRVRKAAHEFVDRYVGANDLVAVIQTGGRLDGAQDFTSSRRLLDRAIDRFMGQKTRSATLGKIDQYVGQRGTPNASDPLRDPDEAERGYKARNTLETLESLSNWMAGIRGRRKAVVFFSEGVDYDITDPINNRYASDIIQTTQDLIGAATRANVSIYSVDPRGLTAFGDDSMEIQSYGPDAPAELSNAGLQSELRLSQDSLRVLADETGGFAAVNSNDMRSAFSRILDESSTYYILGYYPANDRRDGRFRKLEVRVTKPGVQVRARRGYVAPKGKVAPPTAEASAGTSTELRDALNSPLPTSGLTMSAFAAPFKAAAPDASVILGVEIGPRDLKFVERNGRYVNELEFSYLAIDQKGKTTAGDRQSLKLDLRPQTFQAVERQGFRVLSRITLPPGRYQLRVAAREANGGKLGSLHYDLDVPDFAKDPLVMSGLLVTSAAASRTPAATDDAELKQVLPAQPTTLREFVPADQLALFVEVYDNRGSTPHTVDITTTVRADTGTVVFKTEDARKSEELKGARGGYGYTAQVPLQGLAPGLYVLRVEARSRLGGDVVVRETPIRIVPLPGGGQE
jgi:VWFA-related protein